MPGFDQVESIDLQHVADHVEVELRAKHRRGLHRFHRRRAQTPQASLDDGLNLRGRRQTLCQCGRLEVAGCDQVFERFQHEQRVSAGVAPERGGERVACAHVEAGHQLHHGFGRERIQFDQHESVGGDHLFHRGGELRRHLVRTKGMNRLEHLATGTP